MQRLCLPALKGLQVEAAALFRAIPPIVLSVCILSCKKLTCGRFYMLWSVRFVILRRKNLVYI